MSIKQTQIIGELYEINETLLQQVHKELNIDTSTFDDTAIVGLFKLRQSVFAPNTIKLDFSFFEIPIDISYDIWWLESF